MDTSEYMPMFLAEAREHLQELNLAVVRLEADPSDHETVNEIFRIAHSIKGMSATMGFARIAELTHKMEDVFELLRQRSGALPNEVIDTLLACLDALSGAVESIQSSGAEALDPIPLIDRLHCLVRPRTPEQERARAGGFTPPNLAAAQAAGERVLHVAVALSDEVMMPAVRAHMVFAALIEHGELIGSTPSVHDVELFSGQRIEAWLICEHEEQAVAATLAAISDVSGVEVREAAATPAPAPATTPPPAPEPAATTPPPAPAAKPLHSYARTVRVDAERLDALMHSMGELVIHRTAVQALTGSLDVPGLHQAMQELTRSSQALQAMVMQVRMIPVEVVFLRFPRLIRDLGSQLGKEVRLDLVGSDTELDRTVVDALGDPLVHLVRNSLDHGLEPPEERIAAGKPPTGTLQLAARHAGGSVVIEVRDDGRGIDYARVARKAVEAGLIDPQAAGDIDVKAAVELLFTPGFSTTEATNDISGRGVGMDVVRNKLRELGGEVLIDSEPGRGTLAQIRLPLTLAIVATLQVDIAGGPYAIPLDRIERTLRLSQQAVQSVAGRRMLVLQDGVLPLVEGGSVFGRRAGGDHEFVVIVRSQERRIALAVDNLIGQRELVTRPLPGIVSVGEPVSGGAALADGRIALIIDCDRLDPRAASVALELAA
ncbi:MAG TPA: chemotaxis protein CheA [Solirubrobacteraceae bacterium]|jgi:two-component system chemotaxis sensor kinase CheA|nr:chemotaxis protein CheA [Solirubrobacteraceae bacterium]